LQNVTNNAVHVFIMFFMLFLGGKNNLNKFAH